MVVHPTATLTAGRYLRNGEFWVDPFNLQAPKDTPSQFDSLPLHEILHSFFGPNHSPSEESTMNHKPVIGLLKDEATHLGWPLVKPVTLHPERYRFVNVGKGRTRKKIVEFYRA